MPAFRCLGSLSFTLLLFASASLAAPPDLTQGDSIPPGATHDWNLGPTGARGWMSSDKLVTSDARQVAITHVEPNTPADGVLAVGDVLLGVGKRRFSEDPRVEFGRAITVAESEAGGGILPLTRWRAGKIEEVELKLPVLGDYSPTAPFDCPKSKRILEQGCQILAKRLADPAYRPNPIPRSLNAWALLASGNDDYLPLVRREAEWAAEFSSGGYKTWYYGYVIPFLAEYVLATGDESVLPGLRRLAIEAAEGQSAVGSWGHRFARENGRLGGYGMMNSPGLPLTIGLVLAREAGVKDPRVDQAIRRSALLLRFYVGKGAIPYGDHHPWTQTHDDNGKCGMAAVLFDLLQERDAAEFFSHMSVASHSAERDTGHTGNFFNMLWAMPGVARCGPHASGAWMEEFGGWYFDLARQVDGGFVHQGPPSLRKDRYAGWDCTGAYLLAYAMPLRKTYLTGRGDALVPQLTPDAASGLIRDGRGWSNQDRNSAYDRLDDETLLQRLGSWSPTVRERAALALARRKADVIPALIEMLDAPGLEARYGACQALELLRGAAAPAVPALRETLRHDDLWLRVQAAEALAHIGDPALPALPELLVMLAKGPTAEDPRGMEQRYLCFAVFGQMLRRSIEGADRELLRTAVAAGLRNQDGRARGALGGVYRRLSYEEIRPLLPAIRDAVAEPAPSGVMFASGIRLEGLDLLARHRIREGLPLCLEVMEIDQWGKQARVRGCVSALQKYGAAAKPLLPELRKLHQDLRNHREAKSMAREIDRLESLIQKLESTEESVELREIAG